MKTAVALIIGLASGWLLNDTLPECERGPCFHSPPWR